MNDQNVVEFVEKEKRKRENIHRTMAMILGMNLNSEYVAFFWGQETKTKTLIKIVSFSSHIRRFLSEGFSFVMICMRIFGIEEKIKLRDKWDFFLFRKVRKAEKWIDINYLF